LECRIDKNGDGTITEDEITEVWFRELSSVGRNITLYIQEIGVQTPVILFIHLKDKISVTKLLNKNKEITEVWTHKFTQNFVGWGVIT
jgi:hypothetical protein